MAKREAHKRPQGSNETERLSFRLAQQRMRHFARQGLALEVDADGVPVPYATGTAMRSPGDSDTLPTSMPALKVKTPVTLGQAVKLWRRRVNRSRRDVASGTGISDRTLVAVERGTPQVRIDTIVRVLDELGLELLIRPKPSIKRLAPDRLYRERCNSDDSS